MLRDLAVARIQQGLGFRSDIADQIVMALQEEQRDLEKGKTLPNFLLVEDEALSLLAGAETVALPARYLRRSTTNLRYAPDAVSAIQFIPWKNYNDAFTAYGASDASEPKVAVLRATAIRFFPTADRNYTIYFTYYRGGVVLAANVENVWLANVPELLIGGAGMRIASDMRNKTALELFTSMYNRAYKAQFGETVVEDQEDDLALGADN